MKFCSNEGSRWTVVPLRDAVLCVDCHFISSASSTQCPICDGNERLDVARVLGVLVEQVFSARTEQLVFEDADFSPALLRSQIELLLKLSK